MSNSLLGQTWLTGNADAIGSPDQFHGILIDSYQADGVHKGQDAAIEATGPHLAVKVAQATVALGGPVELGHLGNVETAGEVGPDGLPETVAQCHAHLVPRLSLTGWLVQEVAAKLANVLYNLG